MTFSTNSTGASNSAILLLAYSLNNDFLPRCIASIRKFHPVLPICIVDRHNGNYVPSDSNIRYHYAGQNGYELGNIIAGVKHYTEWDNFLIMHDACFIIAPIPELPQDSALFVTSKFDIAPALGIVKHWLSKLDIESKMFDSEWNICQGLMGYFSRGLLQKLIDIGLDRIKVTTKIEAVASEGLLGF